MTLDEYVDRWLGRHDELAYRKLRGEALTAEEADLLTKLNDLADCLLPPSSGLDKDIKAIVEVALAQRPIR